MRVVAGALAAVVGAIVAAAGAMVGFWFVGSDGVRSNQTELNTEGAAIATTPEAIRFSGELRVTAEAADSARVFIGLAHDTHVQDFLSDTAHLRVTELDTSATLTGEQVSGKRTSLATAQDRGWWETSVSGEGPQTLELEVPDGPYDLVIMHADGSPGLSVDASFGVGYPGVYQASLIALGVGAVVLIGGVLLLVLGRGRRGEDVDDVPVWNGQASWGGFRGADGAAAGPVDARPGPAMPAPAHRTGGAGQAGMPGMFGAPVPGQADGQPGFGQAGAGRPAPEQPGFGQPGFGQPGAGQPAMEQPGFGQPGFGQPGMFGPPSQPAGFGEPARSAGPAPPGMPAWPRTPDQQAPTERAGTSGPPMPWTQPGPYARPEDTGLPGSPDQPDPRAPAPWPEPPGLPGTTPPASAGPASGPSDAHLSGGLFDGPDIADTTAGGGGHGPDSGRRRAPAPYNGDRSAGDQPDEVRPDLEPEPFRSLGFEPESLRFEPESLPGDDWSGVADLQPAGIGVPGLDIDGFDAGGPDTPDTRGNDRDSPWSQPSDRSDASALDGPGWNTEPNGTGYPLPSDAPAPDAPAPPASSAPPFGSPPGPPQPPPPVPRPGPPEEPYGSWPPAPDRSAGMPYGPPGPTEQPYGPPPSPPPTERTEPPRPTQQPPPASPFGEPSLPPLPPPLAPPPPTRAVPPPSPTHRPDLPPVGPDRSPAPSLGGDAPADRPTAGPGAPPMPPDFPGVGPHPDRDAPPGVRPGGARRAEPGPDVPDDPMLPGEHDQPDNPLPPTGSTGSSDTTIYTFAPPTNPAPGDPGPPVIRSEDLMARSDQISQDPAAFSAPPPFLQDTEFGSGSGQPPASEIELSEADLAGHFDERPPWLPPIQGPGTSGDGRG